MDKSSSLQLKTPAGEAEGDYQEVSVAESSFDQEWLWFLDQLELGNPAYNNIVLAQADGGLSISALEQSISEISRRHEVLRTTFLNEEGRLLQVIAPETSFRIHLADLSGIAAPLTRQIVDVAVVRPFDLTRGPLFHFVVFKLSPRTHILALIRHHIIFDGWSDQLFLNEVQSLYESFVCGSCSALLELPIQYADYAQFQREHLTDEVLGREISFWRERLRDASPIIDLPLAAPRPAVRSLDGDRRRILIPDKTTTGLTRVARAQEATLFMVVAAVFKLLLFRYSGQTDILIGSPTSTRGRRELEPLLGCFVNTIVLRTDLSGDPSFDELVSRIRATVLEAHAHSSVPFQKIVQELQPHRSLGYQPFLQVILSLAGDPARERVLLKGLALRPLRAALKFVMSELELAIAETEFGLAVDAQFNTHLFDAPGIERMLRHFRRLAEQAVEQPGLSVSRFHLLEDDELAQLMVEWNDTADHSCGEAGFESLFQAQAARTPDSIACDSGERQISYAELNRRAGNAARYLIEKGLAPDQFVALLVERSPEYLILITASLLAGAAFFPLDPREPPSRLSKMIEVSRCGMVVADDRNAGLISEAVALGDKLKPDILPLAEVLSASSARCDTRTESAPTSLAYAIFSSGSTGMPKGAMIERSGMLNHIREKVSALGLNHDDVLAQTSPPSFDIVVWQFLAPILVGARVSVVADEAATNPVRLLDHVDRAGVTILQLVPSLLKHVVREVTLRANSLSRSSPLRWIVPTGEALQVELCRKWFAVYPSVPMLNNCGATECSDDYLHYVIPDADALDAAPSPVAPIGRPIANVGAYVLDRNLEPVPLGVDGELLAGGIALGRGYLEDPVRTAETFVPHPFSQTAGDRLYRSRDIVRYMNDGNLEIRGRIDDSVKINGIRVDLGEIEAAMERHAFVLQAVAGVHENEHGVKRLTAYFVASGDLDSKIEEDFGSPEFGTDLMSELRESLRQTLPDYLVPAHIIRLESLPLNKNGKVDRHALPVPESMSLPASGTRVAPRTRIERILAGIWEDILGVRGVGVLDNFFELGGDSIVSIQVVARANAMGVTLSPKQVFAHQTIAELAAAAEPVAPRHRIGPDEPERGVVELTAIQRWFFEHGFEAFDHWNQAMMLRARARINPHAINAAFQELTNHHGAFALRFTQQGDGWIQSYSHGDCDAPVVVDLTGLPAESRRRALEACAARVQASLNLSAGPLHRMVLFRLDDREERLLIVIHHLIVEGVSWRIIIEDLHNAYLKAARGEQIDFPAKTGSWKAWAGRISEFARSAEVAEDLRYWLEQCRVRLPRIPVDLENGLNLECYASEVEMILSEEETKLLITEAHRAHRTQTNELLIAALVPVLAEWAGATQVALDMVGHGREDLFDGVDITRTVGWFSTLFPVVFNADPGTNIEALIESVKETLRRVPRRGLSYGLLRYSTGDKAISEGLSVLSPEICFDYLGQTNAGARDEFLFEIATESTGPTRADGGQRRYLLEISSIITGTRLKVLWRYGKSIHSADTVTRLAERHIESLKALIGYCTDRARAGYRPSDFEVVSSRPAPLEISRHTPAIEDIYPLSPLQQGLMFHSIHSPGSGVYVLQWVLRLAGKLDINAFKRAWQKVIDRHAVLRTGFVWSEDSDPYQIVHREAVQKWEELDWSGDDPEDQERHLDQFLEGDLKDFELDKPPLMRLATIRLAEAAHYLVWTHHHLLLDGWSLAIVLHDVVSLYTSLVKQAPSTLPDAPPYRDYIAWVRRLDSAGSRAYWQNALAGFDTPLAVDLDAPTGTTGFAECSTKLSVEDVERLQSLARTRRLTINTLVQGAWAVLLKRYCRSDDVLYGITVSGRPHSLPGVERMVGLFINTLPFRVTVPAHEDLWEWLNDVQSRQLQLREHELTPLVEIRQWSEVPAGIPLFESIVVFENFPVDGKLIERAAEEGLEIEIVRVNERTNYPLTLVCSGLPRMDLRLSYDRGRFEECTVQRMVNHVAEFLKHLDSVRRVGDFPLLSESEIQQLTIEWSGDQAAAGCEAGIYELAERQARMRADAIAVVFEDQHVTYGELISRAGMLASRIAPHVKSGRSLVGVLVDRSPDIVVAILGVLKNGATYLPIDPSIPDERLLNVLDQTAVVVTSPSLAAKLPPVVTAVLVSGNGEIRDYSPAVTRNPEADLSLIAYCLYTSGSTGDPKGVLVDNRNVVSLIMNDLLPVTITEQDTWTMLHSYCFDFSVWEMFGSLLHGGKLIIASAVEARDPEKLLGLLIREKVTILSQTPASFYNVAEEALRITNATLCLKCVVFGGSVLYPERLKGWKYLYPDVEMINMYGITETTVHTTFKIISGDDMDASISNIGRPLPGARIYLLGSDLQPVPIGVAGELFVGGSGVSRGYMNLPAQTAERFIPSPFDSEPGQVIYRTGDLARFLPSGDLEYLGRSDNQVKVRGYRIELEEVETALRRLPTVKEAAVLTRRDPDGDSALVAYLVMKDQSEHQPSDLRVALSRCLPDYMIPSAFVFLDAMPLNRNCKLDRRALAELGGAPHPGKPESSRRLRAPQERLLESIWRDVLGKEDAGLDDNFFELGGHSLLAVRLIMKVRAAFAVDLPIASIFERPTISSLLEAISELAGGDEAVERIALIAGRNGATQDAKPDLPRVQGPGPHPLSPGQYKIWLVENLLGGSPFFNIFCAVHLKGTVNLPAIEQALSMITLRHQALRTVFVTDGGEPAQVINPRTSFRLEIADIIDPEGASAVEAIERLIAETALRPFDLSAGLLMRAVVVLLGPRDCLLLVTLHHIIADGWSMDILGNELAELYSAFSNGGADTLEPLPIQFSDLAHWQRGWRANAELKSQFDFWKRVLVPQPPNLFPAGLSEGTRLSLKPEVVTRAMSIDTTKAIQAFIGDQRVSLFMIVFAALASLLRCATGKTDIVVGTIVANRSRRELQDLIGLVANTIVIRADLASDPAYLDLVRAARAAVNDALANQDAPFDELMAELERESGLRAESLLRVMLVVQNIPFRPLRLPGLEVDVLNSGGLGAEMLATTVDLTFVVEQQEDGACVSSIVYRPECFKKDVVEMLSSCFDLLLQRAMADPAAPISTLSGGIPLLTDLRESFLTANLNPTAARSLTAPKPHR